MQRTTWVTLFFTKLKQLDNQIRFIFKMFLIPGSYTLAAMPETWTEMMNSTFELFTIISSKKNLYYFSYLMISITVWVK